jgi:hypothetical protein
MDATQVSKDKIEKSVEDALKELLSEDHYLLEKDVNERTISHKFAMYLQCYIDRDLGKGEWNVDCEYNRDVESTEDPYQKLLNIPRRRFRDCDEDSQARTVYPDVIIHERGKPNNLLVIEIKKSTCSRRDERYDREIKIPAYRNQLGYIFGLFLMFKVIDDVRVTKEWFPTE